jgi:Leucine-rich repeat (LRR) protein
MNRITHLDLQPLENCPELRALDIAGNNLESLDLSPLAKCKSLEDFYIYSDHPDENNIRELDISPLFACRNLADMTVSRDTEIPASATLRTSDDIPFAIEDLIEEKRIEWQ